MLTLLRDTVREWREDGANRLAAALAYYTTFSLAPLLVLIIAIAGLVGGQEAAQTRTMDQVEDLLGTEGREFVQEMIEPARPGPTATLVGALGVFGKLQNSLNTIREVKPQPASRCRRRTNVCSARESPTDLQHHPPLFILYAKLRMILDTFQETPHKFSIGGKLWLRK